jgi:hypothetical protein
VGGQWRKDATLGNRRECINPDSFLVRHLLLLVFVQNSYCFNALANFPAFANVFLRFSIPPPRASSSKTLPLVSPTAAVCVLIVL